MVVRDANEKFRYFFKDILLAGDFKFSMCRRDVSRSITSCNNDDPRRRLNIDQSLVNVILVSEQAFRLELAFLNVPDFPNAKSRFVGDLYSEYILSALQVFSQNFYFWW